MKKTIQFIYITLSLIFLGLAFIGIILPVLPATPFLLLSSYFALKGSKKLNQWIINSNFYKDNIQDFVEKGGMTIQTKKRILTIASFFLVISFLLTKSWFLRGFIIFLIGFKYYYFFNHIKIIPETHLEQVIE